MIFFCAGPEVPKAAKDGLKPGGLKATVEEHLSSLLLGIAFTLAGQDLTQEVDVFLFRRVFVVSEVLISRCKWFEF
jgi:hypothetical protein